MSRLSGIVQLDRQSVRTQGAPTPTLPRSTGRGSSHAPTPALPRSTGRGGEPIFPLPRYSEGGQIASLPLPVLRGRAGEGAYRKGVKHNYRLNRNSLLLRMLQYTSSITSRRCFASTPASSARIPFFSCSVGSRLSADRYASSTTLPSGVFSASSFSIRFPDCFSFLFTVSPLAMCSTWAMLGSSVRSHSQVSLRSARPKDSRK